MENSPLQKIKAAYEKALKLGEDDKLIVDCFVSVLTAAFHLGLDESVWFFFIGPPGSGKTEVVYPVKGYRRCLMLTTPTENALISGYSDETGEDPSLLKLLDGKVLIWKDFTALMEAGRRLVDKVLGEFRDCYDQFCSKASGKVGLREYEARFGMIACVTDKIDGFAEEHQQLGQRFLSFRINRLSVPHSQRVEDLKKIVKSMEGKKSWKEQLRTTVQLQLDKIERVCKGGKIPEVSAGAKEQVLILADLLALARTVPMDRTAVRPELATRVVQQLMNLGHAHAVADGRSRWNDSELKLIRRVVLDSLPLVRQRLLTFLYRQGPHRPAMPVEQLAKKCRSPEGQMKNVITQYLFSGLLEVSAGDKTAAPYYRISPDIYDSITKTGVLK